MTVASAGGRNRELFRHQYLAARWAHARGVRKLEFWCAQPKYRRNYARTSCLHSARETHAVLFSSRRSSVPRAPRNEPDTAPCITYYSWLEHFTLQSQAVQNAFADANAAVAAGALACAQDAACPLQPAIYASAFAQAQFNGTAQQAAGGAATARFPGSPGYYPDDYYAYLGQARHSFPAHTPRGRSVVPPRRATPRAPQVTVANEHTAFPPWLLGGGTGFRVDPAAANQAAVQNMHAFSAHSCAREGMRLWARRYLHGDRLSCSQSLRSETAPKCS